MHYIKIYSKVILAILAVLIPVSVVSLFFWAKSKLPDYDGRLAIDGLEGKVEIVRDSYGMAHIYAENDNDLYFAFGYTVAQDRLLQMDLMRRMIRGRLSEVFGRKTLESDKLFRIITSVKSVDEIVKELSPSFQRAIHAYTKGINHFIKKAVLPVEFSLLGYRPEAWQPGDSMTVYYMMAWRLSIKFKFGIICTLLGKKLGKKRVEELCPYPISRKSKIFTSDQAAMHRFIAADSTARNFSQIGHWEGSNAWVVSGEKSATGSPLLAGDPHLNFSLPGTWYEVHLITPRWNISGAAIAGVPLIAIGANPKVAWAFTVFGEDSADLYYETLDPNNDERYLFKGQFEDMRVLRQNIGIKEEKDQSIRIRITRHGPIINDLLDKDSLTGKDGRAIALRWTAHDHYTSPQGIYMLGRAQSIDDIEKSAEYYNTPGMNWVYADSQGNIGYTAAACSPSRRGFDGLLPLDGASGRYEWGHCLPIKKKLRLRNPNQNWIASANHAQPDVHRQRVNPYAEASIRFQRIQEMLTEKEKLSIQDFQRIQNDTKVPGIDEWKSMFAALPQDELNDKEREKLTKLMNWNGYAKSSGEPGAVIFCAVREHLLVKILSHLLNPEELRSYLKYSPAVRSFLLQVIKQRKSPWFDDPSTNKTETRQDMLLAALRSSTAKLEREFGTDAVDQWDWGKIHGLKIYHPLGRSSALLAWLLNRGHYPMGGTGETLNRTKFSRVNSLGDSKTLGEKDPRLFISYQITGGSSIRYIIDLAKPDRSARILPTGNSGHFMSAHYSDQMEMFARGEYRPFYLSRQKILQDVQHRLIAESAK